MSRPLADVLRPQTIEDVVGQEHILGKDKALYKIIKSGKIPNMIFYGPPGVGKTTVAQIIANQTRMRLHKLNGTTASVNDIRGIIEEVGTLAAYDGILLYIDEIQYFNKKQQQTLLEFIENGSITLIASTTENPYFYVFSAILSRSTVFEFQLCSSQDIEKAAVRGYNLLKDETKKEFTVSDEVVKTIAKGCGGDVRKALNAVELTYQSSVETDKLDYIDLEITKQLVQKSSVRYDRADDEHYNILSAFQKSIRGSDPDAAVHYLARLLIADDLPSVCRRMLVTASEDIGLAYPQAISIVKSCVDAALQVGLPEGRIPLTQAVLLLATAPKSNSAINAIAAAYSDIEKGNYGDVPKTLKDGHYGGAKKMGNAIGYQYPHEYPNHWIEQQYLPDEIKNVKYYEYGENKNEQAAKAYWEKIKKKKG